MLRVIFRRRKAPRKAGSISGTVVDADGQPIEGLEINLAIETDDTQRYEIADHRRARRLSRPSDREGELVSGDRQPGQVCGRSPPQTMTAAVTDPITLPPIPWCGCGRSSAGSSTPRAAGGRRPRAQLGQPRAAVRRGDRPERPFQLDGFPREKSSLFVDAPGYRFHRAEPDPREVNDRVILRREDQPAERGVVSLGPPIRRQRSSWPGRSLKP